MLRSIESLKGLKIQATDGELGSVEECFFDDQRWVIRYLVVNTSSWLAKRQVLLSPIAVQGIDAEAGHIRVSLTRQQVENSPDIDTDKPVSRQMEIQYYDYYRWPYYWTGAGIWGVAPYPGGILGRPYPIPAQTGVSRPATKEEGDPHLRSSEAVRGYGVQATDESFGHVEDYIFDDERWMIRYLVIDTVNFWPSKSILISPEWVDEVDWGSRKIVVGLPERKIKGCPEYHPDAPINRDYEGRIFDYYGRPRYWERDESTDLQLRAKSSRRFVI